MPIYTMVAIYFIIWWLVFFTVLPWGVRSPEEDKAEVVLGNDPGAPTIHGLGRKMAWTSVVAAIVFAVFYWAYVARIVSFDDLSTLWGLLKV